MLALLLYLFLQTLFTSYLHIKKPNLRKNSNRLGKDVFFLFPSHEGTYQNRQSTGLLKRFFKITVAGQYLESHKDFLYLFDLFINVAEYPQLAGGRMSFYY